MNTSYLYIALSFMLLASMAGSSDIGEPVPTAASKDVTATSAPSTKPPILAPSSIPTLGIRSTRIAKEDGMTQVYVSAGSFTMGSGHGSDGELVHTITLNAFWIDRTEVTNATYALCVKAGKCSAPKQTKSFTRNRYYGNSQYDNYPVIYVSWNDAIKYCGWTGRRLPTEAEWEKAARGTDGRTYPWGNAAPDLNKLNYDYNVGDTTEVGKYPGGASPYGALDMAGNVWEWVSSQYKSYPYNATDGRESLTGNESRVLRGGAWNYHMSGARASFRSWFDESLNNGTVGFRCASSPSSDWIGSPITAATSTPVRIGPTQTSNLGQTKTYVDTAIGYAFDYPANWSSNTNGGVVLYSPNFYPALPTYTEFIPPAGETKIDINIKSANQSTSLGQMVINYKKDLEIIGNGEVVLREEQLVLASGLPAVRIKTNAPSSTSFFTIINGRNLTLHGWGNEKLIDSIAQTLRPLKTTAVVTPTHTPTQKPTTTIATPQTPCYTLNASSTDGGNIKLNPPFNCTAGYTLNTKVDLEAQPKEGFVFAGWSGDISCDSKRLGVIMTTKTIVKANFAPAPKSQKPIVVLVHGWHGLGGGTKCPPDGKPVKFSDNPKVSHDFGMFPTQLEQDGFEVYIAYLDTRMFDTPLATHNATCLKNQLAFLTKGESKKADKVILIAHSLGGVVSRAYLEGPEYIKTDNVSQLITLGTPHTGTLAAEIPCWAPKNKDYGACTFSRSGMSFFNSFFSRRASGVSYTFIGGDLTPIFLGITISSTEGKNDGIIGVNSGMGMLYRGLILRPVWIVYGDNVDRYSFPVGHTSSVPTWAPSYFDNANNENSPYKCVLYLLDAAQKKNPPRGKCPNPIKGSNDYLLNEVRFESSSPLDKTNSQTGTLATLSNVAMFSGHLNNGQSLKYMLPIDGGDQSLFTLVWNKGKINFVLTDPLGKIVDPTYAAKHSGEVSFNEGTTYPDAQTVVSYIFTKTMIGTYALNITAEDVGADGADFSTHVLVESPRTLEVSTDNTLYKIGSKATITANLKNAGVGLAGATVQAQVYKVGSGNDAVILSDQGNGVYSGTYTIPETPGYIGLSIAVQGSDGGILYARQSDELLAISSPTVQLTGNYKDYPSDLDGNGKYEYLNLSLGVNVTRDGSYLISGDLVGTNKTLVAHSVISTTVKTGSLSVILPFEGDELRRSKVNGSYILTNLTIIDQQNTGIPSIWQTSDLWKTSNYNSRDFASTCYVLDLKSNIAASASIIANPAPNCNNGLQYTSDSVVTLTAKANKGYTFTKWVKDGNGTSNPLTISMERDRDIIANFSGADSTPFTPPTDTENFLFHDQTTTLLAIIGGMSGLGLILLAFVALVLLRPKPNKKRKSRRRKYHG